MRRLVVLGFVTISAVTLFGQGVPITPNPKGWDEMVKGPNKKLEANKRLVYNFWREVIDSRHTDLAPKYLAEDYIQHNPGMAPGLPAFMETFSRLGGGKPPGPINAVLSRPPIALIAEGDLVLICWIRDYTDPKDPTKKYNSGWFDLFRIENGKIKEHWDAATKPAN